MSRSNTAGRKTKPNDCRRWPPTWSTCQVAVIAATRSAAPAKTAMAATSTIPIVFQTGSDPVKDGLVASLNRPGGNVTGATQADHRAGLEAARRDFGSAPKATVIGMLANPNGVQTAAPSAGNTGSRRRARFGAPRCECDQ